MFKSMTALVTIALVLSSAFIVEEASAGKYNNARAHAQRRSEMRQRSSSSHKRAPSSTSKSHRH